MRDDLRKRAFFRQEKRLKKAGTSSFFKVPLGSECGKGGEKR